jgi:hypothetical protein
MNETKQIAFRFNDKDFERLEQIANSESVSIHSYIKSFVKANILDKKPDEDYFKLYLEQGNLNLLLNKKIKALEDQLLKQEIEERVLTTDFLFDAYKKNVEAQKES